MPLHPLNLHETEMTPHSSELFHTAIVTLTPTTTLRMAAVIAGVAITLIGLVLWYRWGLDDHKVSTLRRFVLPVVVSITGTMLAAVGATLTFVPSLSAPAAGSRDSETSIRSAQPAGADSPAERRKGSVVLTDGYAVDFDSRDADWNITQAKYIHFEERLDLRLFTLLGVHIGIVKVAPSAGYFDCANSSGHQTEIAHDRFSDGDTFCVETNEGRWARVAITAKETDSTHSTRVRMNVVVWEKH